MLQAEFKKNGGKKWKKIDGVADKS